MKIKINILNIGEKGNLIKMKKVVTLLLTLSLIVSITGCGNGNTKNNKNDVESENLSVTEEETSNKKEEEEKQRIEKYNAYIQLNNFLVSRFDKELNSYYEDVKYQEAFERVKSLGQYTISDGNIKIVEQANKFTEQEPKMDELDGNVKDLYSVLNELINNMNELSQYVEMKNYVDDDYAKAREFHSKIYSLSNQYYDLEQVFTKNLSVLSDEEEKKDLDEFNSKEYYGKYYALSVLIKAREIETYLSDNNYVGQNILSLDVNQFKESYYNELVSEINECMKYLNDIEELKKEGFKVESNEVPYNVKQCLDSMTEMKTSATEIIDRVQKQTPISDFDARSEFFLSTNNGSFEKYSEKVSKFIDEYNKLSTANNK